MAENGDGSGHRGKQHAIFPVSSKVMSSSIPLGLRFCPFWPFVIVSALVTIRAVPCKIILAHLQWGAYASSVSAQLLNRRPLKERPLLTMDGISPMSCEN